MIFRNSTGLAVFIVTCSLITVMSVDGMAWPTPLELPKAPPRSQDSTTRFQGGQSSADFSSLLTPPSSPNAKTTTSKRKSTSHSSPTKPHHGDSNDGNDEYGDEGFDEASGESSFKCCCNPRQTLRIVRARDGPELDEYLRRFPHARVIRSSSSSIRSDKEYHEHLHRNQPRKNRSDNEHSIRGEKEQRDGLHYKHRNKIYHDDLDDFNAEQHSAIRSHHVYSGHDHNDEDAYTGHHRPHQNEEHQRKSHPHNDNKPQHHDKAQDLTGNKDLGKRQEHTKDKGERIKNVIRRVCKCKDTVIGQVKLGPDGKEVKEPHQQNHHKNDRRAGKNDEPHRHGNKPHKRHDVSNTHPSERHETNGAMRRHDNPMLTIKLLHEERRMSCPGIFPFASGLQQERSPFHRRPIDAGPLAVGPFTFNQQQPSLPLNYFQPRSVNFLRSQQPTFQQQQQGQPQIIESRDAWNSIFPGSLHPIRHAFVAQPIPTPHPPSKPRETWYKEAPPPFIIPDKPDHPCVDDKRPAKSHVHHLSSPTRKKHKGKDGEAATIQLIRLMAMYLGIPLDVLIGLKDEALAQKLRRLAIQPIHRIIRTINKHPEMDDESVKSHFVHYLQMLHENTCVLGEDDPKSSHPKNCNPLVGNVNELICQRAALSSVDEGTGKGGEGGALRERMALLAQSIPEHTRWALNVPAGLFRKAFTLPGSKDDENTLQLVSVTDQLEAVWAQAVQSARSKWCTFPDRMHAATAHANKIIVSKLFGRNTCI